MSVEEKAVQFLTALSDVYRDEEHRELEAFPQMKITDDFTEDFTAMLIICTLSVNGLLTMMVI